MSVVPRKAEWECFNQYGSPVQSGLDDCVSRGGHLVRDTGDGDMFPDCVLDAPFTGHDLFLDIIDEAEHVLLGSAHIQLFSFSPEIDGAQFTYCCDAVDQSTYDMSVDIAASGLPLEKALLIVRGFEVSPTRRKSGVGTAMVSSITDYLRSDSRYASAFARVENMALCLYTDSIFAPAAVNKMIALTEQVLRQQVSITPVRMMEAKLRNVG